MAIKDSKGIRGNNHSIATRGIKHSKDRKAIRGIKDSKGFRDIRIPITTITTILCITQLQLLLLITPSANPCQDQACFNSYSKYIQHSCA